MMNELLCADNFNYEWIKKQASKKYIGKLNVFFLVAYPVFALLLYIINSFGLFILTIVCWLIILIYTIFESLFVYLSKRFIKVVEEISVSVPNEINGMKFGQPNFKMIIGRNLIKFFDEHYADKEDKKIHNGMFMPLIQLLREKTTGELGYVIPKINIQDNQAIQENQCEIYIRDNFKLSFPIYPDFVAVKELPSNVNEDDTIKIFYPCYEKQLYIIKDKSLLDNYSGKKYYALNILFDMTEYVSIKYVDELIEESDMLNLIKLLKKQYKHLYNSLLEKINVTLIKNVYSNLIKEKISLNDLVRFFELILTFGKEFNPDDISEKIREDNAFRTQITNKFAIDNQINAYELSDELSVLIENAKSCKDETAIIEKFKNKLDTNASNIIVCNKNIRLKLYRLLNEIFDKTSVIAYSEILKSTNVNTINIID